MYPSIYISIYLIIGLLQSAVYHLIKHKIYLSIYVYVYLYIYLYICLCIQISIYLYVYRSSLLQFLVHQLGKNNKSIYPSIYDISLSIYTSIYNISLSIYTSIYMSNCLSRYLSIFLFIGLLQSAISHLGKYKIYLSIYIFLILYTLQNVPNKNFMHFQERLDNVSQNCFSILKLVVYLRYLKTNQQESL